MKSLGKSIYPEWELNDWLAWPPNTFALLSIILQRTGAYKLCLSKSDNLWDDNKWQKNVEDDATRWLDFSTDLILGKKRDIADLTDTALLTLHLNKINHYWDVIEMDRLRVLNYDDDVDEFVSSIIAIYAIADYTCRGLGLIGETIKEKNKKFKLLHFTANLLLNNYGSLSTIPKFHGIVLPKLRTPQSGLVLRSLSHYLTFHLTEVEVVWRTFPWLNNHKQSLNILAVPYPFRVKDANFNIIEDQYHSVRYFEGIINEANMEQKIESLVDIIVEHTKNKTEIDILVLPETSLTGKWYYALLNQLEKGFLKEPESKVSQLPVVICGVLNEAKDDKKSSCSFHNEVRMATFFSNRWYEIKQRKHHRWQLDRHQILQYKLEGKFDTHKSWFEHSSISQRRLTILSPNSWLTLTSLICEDLARQEPVGDLIRGIGPTLLIALLSDGPQFQFRWSARYASILADDPGTAVLSLTSLGMVKRSQSAEAAGRNTPITPSNRHTVGLWKDMIKGTRELNLHDNNSALLFTISANFKEEFTIDGRTDHTNASVFQLDTLTPDEIPIRYTRKEHKKKTDHIKPVTQKQAEEKFGNWEDIRDVSALMYAVDSIIDILSLDCVMQKYKRKQINIILAFFTEPEKETGEIDFFSITKNTIAKSWENPESVGIEKLQSKRNQHTEIVRCISLITEFLKDDYLFSIDCLFTLYDTIIKKIETILRTDTTKDRIIKITHYAFLYDIMSKISKWQPKNTGEKFEQEKTITPRELIDLKSSINSILEEHNY